MTPLTTNPTIVIEVIHGTVVNVATNVAPDLKVVVTTTPERYAEEACNKPFDTVRLPADLSIREV